MPKDSETEDQVHFLLDEPSDEDFFGPHSEVAAAIARVVSDNDDINVIGLVGSWGSGKSTVVKGLRTTLQSGKLKDELYFFTYDAWLHQNDPPRRAFLETLINALLPDYLSDEKTWRERLSELSGKTQDTTTDVTKEFTKTGRWVFLSLGLVPLGMAFLGYDLINTAFGGPTAASQDSVTFARRLFALSLALTAAPLIVVSIFYALWRPWPKGWGWFNPKSYFKRGFLTTNKEGHENESVLALLTQHSVERSENRTKISPDPTAIEFRSAFRDVVIELSRSKKRLVIVIDNLDRLAEDEAMQLWGTIRSLFLERIGEQREAVDTKFRPKVILPIDGGSVERMFAASHNDPARPNQARELAASFMDKTFDITFYVNEPVMSGWRSFLLAQMKRVFLSSYQPSWGFWTRRLFEEYAKARQKKITPRDVNRLLNRIAALYLQRNEAGIDVEVMAIYAIYRDEIGLPRYAENGVSDLLSFLNISSFELERTITNLKLQLVALYYGVPLDQAAQVLLEDPIRSAVRELDRDAFARLRGTPGFAETFELVISGVAADAASNFIDITNAALLLDDFEEGDEVGKSTSWRSLVDAASNAAWPEQFDDDLAARLKSLFEHATPDQGEDLLDQVAGGLDTLLRADTKTSPKALRGAALETVKFARAKGLEIPTFNLGEDIEKFLLRMAQFSIAQDAWKQLRTDASNDELGPAIQALGRGQLTSARLPRVIECLVTGAGENTYSGENAIDWDPIINDMADVVRNGPGQNLPTAPPLQGLGLLISTQGQAQVVVKELISDGTMDLRGNDASVHGRWDELATIYAMRVWQGENFRPPEDKTWTALQKVQPDFAKEVVARLVSFVGNDAMRLVWISHKNGYSSTYFIEDMMEYLIADRNLGGANTSHILTNIEFYRRETPYRLRQGLVAILEARSNFWDQLENLPIGRALKEVAVAVSKAGNEQKERAERIVQSRLSQATIEEWQKALNENAEPISLATEFLRPETLKFDANSSLYLCLTGNLNQLVSGATKAISHRWFALSNCLATRACKKAHRALGSALLAASPRDALGVLKVGGAAFLRSSGMLDEPNQVAEGIVLRLLSFKEGRAWLRDNQDTLKSPIANADPKLRKELQRQLKRFVSGKKEEPRYWAEVIGGNWKIKTK